MALLGERSRPEPAQRCLPVDDPGIGTGHDRGPRERRAPPQVHTVAVHGDRGIEPPELLVQGPAHQQAARGSSEHRDGVDLGWRATLAGSTVMTCPGARIVHRQASLRGLRAGTLAEQRHRTEMGYDQYLGMRTVLAHHRGLGAIGVALRLTLGTLFRALGLLMGKRPEASLEELQALQDLIVSGKGTGALRRRIALLGATKQTRRRVARLRPHSLSSIARSAVLVWEKSQDRLRLLTTSSDMTLDELTGDDFAGGPIRARAVWPWIAGTLAVLALVVAGRRLIGNGVLTSTGLLPAPGTIAAAVTDYIQRPAGAAVSPAPWEGLAAIASIVGIFPTWAAVAALWLAVPAAGLAMASFLQPFVRSAPVSYTHLTLPTIYSV